MGDIMEWMFDNSLILSFSFGIVLQSIWLVVMRKKTPMKIWEMPILFVITAILGYIAARIMGMIEGFSLIPEGKLRIYGAFLFLIGPAYLITRIKKWDMADGFDVLSICLVMVLFLFRINCILHGCCYGIEIVENSGIRWPIREAEELFYICFLIYYVPQIYTGKTYGQVYPAMLISYGVLRFIIELFRVEYTTVMHISWLHWGYIWSILSIAVGTVWIRKLRFQKIAQGGI